MKDLTIPIPNDGNTDTVEITVKVGAKKINYNFKVETFPWEVDDDTLNNDIDDISNSLLKVEKLKNIIKDYDKKWELIQIFTPAPGAKNIQILFRERKQVKQSGKEKVMFES